MSNIPSLEIWRTLEHAVQRSHQSEWNVCEDEGLTLATAVANELTSMLDGAVGVVSPHSAWGVWMMSFRTPLLYDRVSLPRTSPPDCAIPCYLGFSLRPWIAGSDWPLPEFDPSRPSAHTNDIKNLVEARLYDFRELLMEPHLTLEEAIVRFMGSGFWVDHDH